MTTQKPEPPQPPKGNLADMVNEGGDEQKSTELSREPVQRQNPESGGEETGDIRR